MILKTKSPTECSFSGMFVHLLAKSENIPGTIFILIIIYEFICSSSNTKSSLDGAIVEDL